MKISDYISDLLLFHEKVIMPGFGAFEIIREPAIIEDRMAAPPGIKIIFNPAETSDDNLLASKIAEAEEIDITEARQRVQEFINEMKSVLDKGNKYAMPGFGELSLDENYNFVFIKDPGFRIEFETSGFETFEIDPLAEEETGLDDFRKEVAEPSEEPEILVPEEKTEKEVPASETLFIENDLVEENESNRNFLWILGGGIVVILISFVILAISTDIFDTVETGLFKPRVKQETESPRLIIGDDQKTEKEIEEELESLNKLENEIRQTEDLPSKELIISSAYSEFHIIAGSFSVYKNAEDLQRELNFRGFPSVIINRGDGFFRVSAISFDDKAKGLEELEKFKSATPYKAAWLMGIN